MKYFLEQIDDGTFCLYLQMKPGIFDWSALVCAGLLHKHQKEWVILLEFPDIHIKCCPESLTH